MSVVAPLPIRDGPARDEGVIIGLEKKRFALPSFWSKELGPYFTAVYEECDIAYSMALDETPSKLEEGLISNQSLMMSESPSRAETVVITNT